MHAFGMCIEGFKLYTTALQENVSLLNKINDLRSELKKTRTMAHNLEATLKIARKQGFDEQAALASTKPRLPETGLTKIEPSDSQRVIEIQRAEISRLRGVVREMEMEMKRPLSGARLPPINPALLQYVQ